jgi:Receptor family ligand binding region
MMWTLDKINKDPNILPNVTLGWDIRDTCWFPPIALEQSVDFITYSIASDEGIKKRDRCLLLAVNERIKSNGTGYYNDCSILKRAADQASKKTIVGLIGPGSSDVTRQVYFAIITIKTRHWM